MEQLQPIRAIGTNDIKARVPATGEPICENVDPSHLFVDHAYQRQVGEKGKRQIRRIVQEFCWTKFKPPICAYAEHDGATVLKVLDGQHTAIAAASNPHIQTIPVMIVDAPETQAQAAAFVGQNTGRLGVTPLQLHQAAVAAGDEDALTAELVCARANITIIKGPAGSGRYRPRETIAVSTVSALVARHTAPGARRILEVLAKADFAPITSHHIRATEHLMTNKEFAPKFDPADLITAMGELYLTAEDDAKVYAHTHRIPLWRALAIIWFRKTKKKRLAVRIAA